MTPKLVDKRLVYMTPEWRHAFRFAALIGDAQPGAQPINFTTVKTFTARAPPRPWGCSGRYGWKECQAGRHGTDKVH